MDVWDGIDAQRRTLCDLLETLTPKQWTTTSLCPEWTVGEVAAHLVADHTVTTRRFLATLVRTRGSVDAANNLLTAEEAARPPRELVANLRRHAENRYVPPGLGVGAVITEMFLHGQDIRVPSGSSTRYRSSAGPRFSTSWCHAERASDTSSLDGCPGSITGRQISTGPAVPARR